MSAKSKRRASVAASSGTSIGILRDTVTSLSQSKPPAQRGFRHIHELQTNVRRLHKEVRENADQAAESKSDIDDLKSKSAYVIYFRFIDLFIDFSLSHAFL